MEKPEIEDLIVKEIAEAKLEFAEKLSSAKIEVAEKRLHFVLWFGSALVAIFGVLLPYFLTQRSSDRVDSAIQEMKNELSNYIQIAQNQTNVTAQRVDGQIGKIENKFDALAEKQQEQIDQSLLTINNKIDELSGLYLRKPKLECFIDGLSIKAVSILLSEKEPYQFIELRNTGDAAAINVRFKLYCDYPIATSYHSTYGRWNPMEVNDELTYKTGYANEEIYALIDPKDSINFEIAVEGRNLIPGEYQALLKIYYGQSEPERYTFKVIIGK